MNTDELTTWLKSKNYGAGTVDVTVRQLGRLVAAYEEDATVPEYAQGTARRVLAYCEATKDAPEFGAYLREQGVVPVTKQLREKAKARKFEARSLEEDDFTRFHDAVSTSPDLRDRVITIMCLTGVRIGDALNIERTRLAAAVKSDSIQLRRKGNIFVNVPLGVREPWVRLHEAFAGTHATNVAELLSPGTGKVRAGFGPYARIDRRLKWWAKELGLSGRMHTHRMRRTFAVRIHKLTKDVVLVAQGLNNGPQATMKYLDESRSAEIAELQQRLSGRKS